MFDLRGVGVEDLAWIHRDQFVHYTELAHSLSDPRDWPRLREDLMQALTAAFGLDAGNTSGARLTPPQRRALEVLDDIRAHHNPATEWRAFSETLWAQRHAIRADLP